MKVNQLKFLALSCLFALISISGKSQIAVVPMGTFATYDDYVKKNLVQFDEIKVGRNGYKGVVKGKKVSGNYSKADFWGIETEEGVFLRLNKKANIPVQIISNSNICFYGGMQLSVSRYYDGSVKSVDFKGVDRGTKFSDIFWVSAGGDGDMMPASMDNLETLMSDSPDLVSKMKGKPINEKDIDKWEDNISLISGWIKEYNQLHTAATPKISEFTLVRIFFVSLVVKCFSFQKSMTF